MNFATCFFLTNLAYFKESDRKERDTQKFKAQVGSIPDNGVESWVTILMGQFCLQQVLLTFRGPFRKFNRVGTKSGLQF